MMEMIIKLECGPLPTYLPTYWLIKQFGKLGSAEREFNTVDGMVINSNASINNMLQRGTTVDYKLSTKIKCFMSLSVAI